MNGRRLCDVVCAAAGLLLLWPVLAILALIIRLRDGSPVLFSQMRVGRGGKQFRMWKFRSMRVGATGSAVTAAGDARITPTGAWLRRFKLDELPQLVNVLRGDMSLIGPRPEAPQYVNGWAPAWKAVLQVRPGITDLATLLYRNEETLLAAASNVDEFYREAVLPAKLRLNLAYLRMRCFSRDVKLVWLTVCHCVSPARFDEARIRESFFMESEYAGQLHTISSAVDR
jgi:lipopolysaccharide/colanic/teichoic acid biosynthesis glycosyltransferase